MRWLQRKLSIRSIPQPWRAVMDACLATALISLALDWRIGVIAGLAVWVFLAIGRLWPAWLGLVIVLPLTVALVERELGGGEAASRTLATAIGIGVVALRIRFLRVGPAFLTRRPMFKSVGQISREALDDAFE